MSRRGMIAATAIASVKPAWAGAANENDRLAAFFESVFQRDLQRNPSLQSSTGLRKGTDYWPDVSDTHAEQDIALVRRDLAELHRFDKTRLSPSARLSYDLFAYDAEEAIERYRWRGNSYSVSQMRGPQRNIPQTLINDHAIHDIADAERYISRIDAVLSYLTEVVAGLGRQAVKGVVMPAFSTPLVIGTCEKLLTGSPFQPSAPDSPILADFRSKVEKLLLSPAAREKLIIAARQSLETSFGPGFRKLIDYLRAEQRCTNCNDGVWQLPDGDNYYSDQLRWNTTLPVSPLEVYHIGLEETERLHDEMRNLMARMEFTGNLKDLFSYVRSSDSCYFPNTAEGRTSYLDAMRAKVATVNDNLHKLTNHIPSAAITVKAVEPWLEASAGTAGYFPPSADGSRPGILYVNTSDMRKLPKYELSALSYHEGLPGHHLEQSVTRALPDLPKFRAFGGYTAYSEGWALFAEQLPLDIGLYDDPWQEFGRLSLELLRASRLVTDTGVHALRWSREKAIAWLDEHVPSKHSDNITAIQRYMVLPGQACAYEMGKLKLVELRDKARLTLGKMFDIRSYNDIVLGSGPMPLPMLEANIDIWIGNGGKTA